MSLPHCPDRETQFSAEYLGPIPYRLRPPRATFVPGNLLGKYASAATIAAALGVSRTTVYRVLSDDVES